MPVVWKIPYLRMKNTSPGPKQPSRGKMQWKQCLNWTRSAWQKLLKNVRVTRCANFDFYKTMKPKIKAAQLSHHPGSASSTPKSSEGLTTTTKFSPLPTPTSHSWKGKSSSGPQSEREWVIRHTCFFVSLGGEQKKPSLPAAAVFFASPRLAVYTLLFYTATTTAVSTISEEGGPAKNPHWNHKKFTLEPTTPRRNKTLVYTFSSIDSLSISLTEVSWLKPIQRKSVCKFLCFKIHTCRHSHLYRNSRTLGHEIISMLW